MSKSKLFNHVHVKVKDLKKSKDFYCSVVEALGLSVNYFDGRSFSIEELIVTQSSGPTHPTNLAFKANNPIAVTLFHDAAIQNGGKSIVHPKIRNFRTGLFASTVLDPDGNVVEAIFRGQKIPMTSPTEAGLSFC